MTPIYSRPSKVIIDRAAILENCLTVQEFLGPAVSVFACLKANAYGHGALIVGAAALEAGVEGLTVGNLESAAELRSADVRAPILCYPGIRWTRETLEAATELGIMVSLTDIGDAEHVASLVHAPLEVFLKIDVGHERLGTAAEDVLEFAQAVLRLPTLRLAGVLTHLFTRPAIDGDQVRAQLDRMTVALDLLEREECLPRYRIAASSGVIGYDEIEFDPRLNVADPGRLLLGLGGLSDAIRVRPAMVGLVSELIQVRELGELAGELGSPYGERGALRVGILPIGRADGLAVVGTREVLVNGRRAPVLEQWVEHTSIDLSDVATARSGDEVVIIGKQGTEEVSIEEVIRAHPALRRPDVTMSIQGSVPRVALSSSRAC